jgi:hypothetical protein
MTTLVWSARQTHPPGGDCRIRPKAGVQRLAAGIEDTFPRFAAFRRSQMGRSLRAGLPPQRLPLPGFLTLSAVLSRHTLVAVFQATSTHRLHGSPELFPPRSALVPLGTSCSPAIECSMTCRTSRHIRGYRDIRPASRTDHQRHTAGDPDSRALLRPGVRHSVRRVNVTRSRCSPDLFSSPRRTNPTVGR